MAGHAEHVRFAVVESALAYCPLPHVGCAVQDVLLEDVAVWYMLAGQALHVRFDVFDAAVMSSPRAHVGCAAHDVLRCDAAVWYVLALHAVQSRLETAPDSEAELCVSVLVDHYY